MSGPFFLKNGSQESLRLRLFPLSLLGEACKWLTELQQKSITWLEEFVTTFDVHFCSPSKIMTIRELELRASTRIAAPLRKTYATFTKTLLCDNMLLQCFYWCLDSVNKGVADQLFPGDLLKKPHILAAQILDGMKSINIAWYTHED